MLRTLAIVVVTGALAIGCQEEAKPLTYDGSSTIGMNIMPKAVEAFAAKTGVKFAAVDNNGSGAGFKAAMAGSVEIGGMSRDLKAKEKAGRPHYRVIGYDAIAVFVHEKNPVKDLTKEQIKGIFSGAVANWKEVGGEDAPINVITEILSGGRATVKVFKAAIMGEAEFGKTTEIDKPVDCVKGVAADPNAITHAALPFEQPSTRAITIGGAAPSQEDVNLGSYPISRPLLLVTKEAPQGAVKQFWDFILTDEAQKIVADAGFFPVR